MGGPPAFRGGVCCEPVFQPVETRRTFEGAVEQITERIAQGELGEGDRLPSERDLAAAMRISRPTLREAIRVLADAGVVSVVPGPGGGMRVASEFVPRDLVQRNQRMRLSEIPGVLEARRLVEPRVAQLAAARAGDEDLSRLQDLVERQRALVARGRFSAEEDRFLQLDTRFHLAIARASGNSTVSSLMRTILGRLEIARDMALHVPLVPDWSIDIHQRTVDAIAAGDLAAVDRVMDEHLAKLEQTWERETGRTLLRRTPDFLLPLRRDGDAA